VVLARVRRSLGGTRRRCTVSVSSMPSHSANRCGSSKGEAEDAGRSRPHPTTQLFWRRADYSNDFGSDRFLGDFLSSSAVSSVAQAGTLTLPSRMISFALSFRP
jgi:hypothetical protein